LSERCRRTFVSWRCFTLAVCPLCEPLSTFRRARPLPMLSKLLSGRKLTSVPLSASAGQAMAAPPSFATRVWSSKNGTTSPAAVVGQAARECERGRQGSRQDDSLPRVHSVVVFSPCLQLVNTGSVFSLSRFVSRVFCAVMMDQFRNRVSVFNEPLTAGLLEPYLRKILRNEVLPDRVRALLARQQVAGCQAHHLRRALS